MCVSQFDWESEVEHKLKMLQARSVIRNGSYCPDPRSFPTTEEFYEAFGAFAITFYVMSGLITLTLIGMFLYLVKRFHENENFPSSRLVPTLWVNSVYFVVALATTFCVVLPQSSHFVWLFYRVFLGLAMGYFVDLTLLWYGGERRMIEKIGKERSIHLRVRPCCCCFICSNHKPLTK